MDKESKDKPDCAYFFWAKLTLWIKNDMIKKIWEKQSPEVTYMRKKNRIYILGHKNPDTDSICSAIALAYLKNHTAQERLGKLFYDDSKEPSVDTIEEVFSVQSVTDEFFKMYKANSIGFSFSPFAGTRIVPNRKSR